MATQKQLKEHFLNLGNTGALYVWGANGQIITKELMDKLFKTFGSKTYTKEYYENKLKVGEGKIGADCSGAMYKVSGYDDTAAGYYDRCTKKGNISSIPNDKVCLVFKKNSSGKINHVGCYTGDGYVSEMASSKLNYQRKKLSGNGWDLWGFPDFVTDYDAASTPTSDKKEELAVDGEWGRDTTTASQKVFATIEDGEISHQLQSCKKYLPNCLTVSWEFDDTAKGSLLIRKIQTFLDELGYYKGEIDGLCGKKTVMAIQTFLNANGFNCGDVDGIMGENTVKAWQMYINSMI